MQLDGVEKYGDDGGEDYLAVIQAKTAALFSAATEIGAEITGRSAGEQAALRLFRDEYRPRFSADR